MKQKREKTTILFVNKNATTLRPIQVPSAMILNWKKCVGALFLLLFSLLGTIAYLTLDNIQQYRFQEILSKKLSTAHTLITEVDTGAVHKKFMKIDKELSIINGFL